MKRWLVTAVSLVGAYIGVSSLVHYVLFPEPGPDPSDLPRRGTTVANEGIHSKFVYRRTSIETDGKVFEWDNYVEPGGGPINIPHLHPHMREIFRVVDGEMRFVIDGEEHIVRAGSEIVAEPGAVHAFQNVTDRPVYMISRFEPAEDAPWEELARKGLLVDSAFVQFDRAGGMGRVGIIQGLVFAGHFKQGYLPGLPVWVQEAMAFLVAPTARLFGVHAYYPPPTSAPSDGSP